MKKRMLFILLITSSMAIASPRSARDCSCLSQEEQEFASQLPISKRKIFCGRFSQTQRQAAMHYTEHHLSPEDAVTRVMEETGIPLAVKSRKQSRDSH